MEAIVVFLCVLLAVFTLAVVQSRFAAMKQVETRFDALLTFEYCRGLLVLMGHLQLHRGMSSAFLAGDESCASQFQLKAAQINTLLPSINHVIWGRAGQICLGMTPNDWSLFRHHWLELVDVLPTLSVEQNIARHGQLIGKIQQSLADIGKTFIEPLAIKQGVVGAASNFVHRLPLLSECLGQARAIGCCITVQQRCQPVDRVRLLFLITRAESLLEQAVAAYGCDSVTGRCQEAIKAMVVTIRTRMLFSAGVVLRPDEFFDISTLAINLVFEWADACLADTLVGLSSSSPVRLRLC